MSQSEQSRQVSDCHQAPVSVRGGEEGTSYYVCGTCHQPCDLFVPEEQSRGDDEESMDEYEAEMESIAKSEWDSDNL